MQLGLDAGAHGEGCVARNVAEGEARGFFFGKHVALEVVADHAGLDDLAAGDVDGLDEAREAWGHFCVGLGWVVGGEAGVVIGDAEKLSKCAWVRCSVHG